MTSAIEASEVDITPANDAATQSPEHRHEGRGRWFADALHPSVLAAALVLALVTAFAVIPGRLAPADPFATDVANMFAPPSASHLFGTDELGRDVFSRFVYGSSTTMSAATIAVLIAFVASVAMGLLAGYIGGRVDSAIMRFVDILLALPSLLVALMLMTALGFGTVNIALAVGIGSIPTFARVMRGEVLKARTREFVTAAEIAGIPWYRVVLRHVLPHSLGPVLTLTALELGSALLSISALSFLGYGAPPPAPEWGAMIASGRESLAYAWWVATLPGLGVLLVVLAVNRMSRLIDRVTS